MLPVKSITVSQVLPILSLALFLSACAGKSNNDEVIKALEESLERSNISLSMSNNSILKTLEDKTTKPATKERAEIWFPKAQGVAKLSSNMYVFIEKVKTWESISRDEAKILLTSLAEYKENILGIDQDIWIEFEKKIPTPLNSSDTIDNTDKKNYTSFFKNLPPLQTSAILTKFQNDIKVTENKIIAFCDMKCGYLYHGFDNYSAIVGQNSKQLMPGGELEIQAGIGAFSRAAMPKININNKNLNIGDEGFATYRLKVSKDPGNYRIPVKISYFNQATGLEERRIVNVEYTVAKECN